MIESLRVYVANREKTGRDVLVNGARLNPLPSQKLHEHSPDGYEFGYGGSGPSQLALAILLDVLQDEAEALKHYQDFKWKFIATAPYEGFVLTSLEILSWYNEVKNND